MCAFDAIAAVHSLSKGFGRLLVATMLQSSVMLTNH
jgi:hypothetical protein